MRTRKCERRLDELMVCHIQVYQTDLFQSFFFFNKNYVMGYVKKHVLCWNYTREYLKPFRCLLKYRNSRTRLLLVPFLQVQRAEWKILTGHIWPLSRSLHTSDAEGLVRSRRLWSSVTVRGCWIDVESHQTSYGFLLRSVVRVCWSIVQVVRSD